MRPRIALVACAVLALATSALAEPPVAERKPRVIIHYAPDGSIARQEIDTKAAGKPNLWVFYERGVMVRQEEDTVGDGKPHVWTTFRDGRVERQDVDTKGTGKADTSYHLDTSGQV